MKKQSKNCFLKEIRKWHIIVGYFSLTNKTTKIKKDVLKGKTKKRMSRFAQFDDGGKYFYVSLPLIGQIGKKVLYVLEREI